MLCLFIYLIYKYLFEYSIKNKELKYRWTNIVDGFDMPIQIKIGNNESWIYPKAEWQTIETPSSKMPIIVDKDFYIQIKEL